MRRSLSAVELKRQIDLAAGRELPELVLKNCRIVNVFTEEILSGDIAIDSGWIVGVGQYRGMQEIDLKNAYVAPGLIDAHVHVESSMLTPGQFAKAVLPHGTTTVIADPHEIANVCGLNGVRYMLEQSNDIPLEVFVMMPSCVPATPFENSGAVIRAEDMVEMFGHPRVLGLGELMDYPGVIGARRDVLDKLIVDGKGRVIDGHGPLLTGKDLNAYVMAGVGTDHECTTEDEMMHRLRLGMYIQIREGSAAKNLKALMQSVTAQNSRRVLFCTDDRHPGDILSEGHIDNNVRKAISGGFPPAAAIRIATLNAAECYQLSHLGAIAPGYQADLIVLLNSPDGYRKILDNERFLPSENDDESPCLADPLEEGGVGISRGLLRVDLHYWLGCGSWSVIHSTYIFRLDNARFRLIGLDSSEFMRNSGERSESSVNFLTGRKKITTGLNESDLSSKPQITWQRLPSRTPIYLDLMGASCGSGGPSKNWCI